jgi:hypothetical protein
MAGNPFPFQAGFAQVAVNDTIETDARYPAPASAILAHAEKHWRNERLPVMDDGFLDCNLTPGSKV